MKAKMHGAAVFSCAFIVLQWVISANSAIFYKKPYKREDYDFVRNKPVYDFESDSNIRDIQSNHIDDPLGYEQDQNILQNDLEFSQYEELIPSGTPNKNKRPVKKPYKNGKKPYSYSHHSKGKVPKKNEIMSYEEPLQYPHYYGDGLNQPQQPQYIVYEKYTKPSMLSLFGMDKLLGLTMTEKPRIKYINRPMHHDKRPNQYDTFYDDSYNSYKKNKKNKYQEIYIEPTIAIKPTPQDLLNLENLEYVKPVRINHNNNKKQHQKNTLQNKKKQTFLIEETKLVEISNVDESNDYQKPQNKKLKKETKVLKEIDIGQISDKEIDSKDLEVIVKIVNNVLEALPESSSVSLKKAA